MLRSENQDKLDKQFDSGKIRYYNSAVYETENEVKLEIVQQELYHMYILKKHLEENNERGFNKCKVIIYGLKANEEVFNAVFERYENVKFREIDL